MARIRESDIYAGSLRHAVRRMEEAEDQRSSLSAEFGEASQVVLKWKEKSLYWAEVVQEIRRRMLSGNNKDRKNNI